jgi:hypothetical protein
MCIAIAPVLYVNANPEASRGTTIVFKEMLKFTAVDVDKVPQKIVDAIVKDHPETTMTKAAVATNVKGEVVYKVDLEDAEGEVAYYLYKEDGTEYIQ